MSIFKKVEELRQIFENEIENVKNEKEWNELRVKFLGK